MQASERQKSPGSDGHLPPKHQPRPYSGHPVHHAGHGLGSGASPPETEGHGVVVAEPSGSPTKVFPKVGEKRKPPPSPLRSPKGPKGSKGKEKGAEDNKDNKVSGSGEAARTVTGVPKCSRAPSSLSPLGLPASGPKSPTKLMRSSSGPPGKTPKASKKERHTVEDPPRPRKSPESGLDTTPTSDTGGPRSRPRKSPESGVDTTLTADPAGPRSSQSVPASGRSSPATRPEKMGKKIQASSIAQSDQGLPPRAASHEQFLPKGILRRTTRGNSELLKQDLLGSRDSLAALAGQAAVSRKNDANMGADASSRPNLDAGASPRPSMPHIDLSGIVSLEKIEVVHFPQTVQPELNEKWAKPIYSLFICS